MRFDADKRLAAAAGGVARYFADEAGLDNVAVSQVQAATVAICGKRTEDGEESAKLEVAVERWPDRIEVVVMHGTTQSSTQQEPEQAPAGIDKVEREFNGSSAVTRLVKFLQQPVSGDRQGREQ